MHIAPHKKRCLREGGIGPEMRSPAGHSAPQKEKRPLRGVGPKMPSSAGLVLRIMPLVATPVNRGVAPASRRCSP
jgi:hypothetical protein